LQKEWKKTWSTEGFQDTRKQSQPLKQMVNMSLNVTYI
jgi:negative regulator of sigma E activity